MSLWYSGPSEDYLDQQRPPIPTESSAVPRCLRSVIQFQFARVAWGRRSLHGAHGGRQAIRGGWNEMGQLGLGEEAGPCVHSPRVLGRLFGRTVGEVSCGDGGSVARWRTIRRRRRSRGLVPRLRVGCASRGPARPQRYRHEGEVELRRTRRGRAAPRHRRPALA